MIWGTSLATIAALLSNGCGRVGFDPREDRVSDVGPAGVAPVAVGPFDEPRLVEELSSPASDDDPTLTSDLLEIYFDSSRAGGLGAGDIWMSQRVTTDAPWAPPIGVTMLNTTGDEDTPELTSDGLTMLFARRNAVSNDEIWMSQRAGRGAPWSSPVRVAELGSPQDDYAAVVDATRLIAVFTSDRDGAARLFMAKRASVAATFDAPIAIHELASDAADSMPWLHDDGTVIAFDSSRSGNFDLYVAVRADSAEPFSAPVRVSQFSTPDDERCPWVSGDLGALFFARSGTDGSRDIYTASRVGQ